MLSHTTIAYLVAIALLHTHPTTSRPLWPNTTSPNACTPSPPAAAAAPPCPTLYPSEYRIMNSRYPSWDQTPLHAQKDFFMLLRQRPDTFQVATQVQFYTPATNTTNSTTAALPPNSTCTLQLQLPPADMQTTAGAEPIFDVYQVSREAGRPASWDTYEKGYNSSMDVFGRVNGTREAQERAWEEDGGLVGVGSTACNETLTWQIGMAFEGGAEVNYWDWVDVQMPFTPARGFRVLVGC